MYLSKSAKDLLEYVHTTDPDRDGFYYGMEFVKSSHYTSREVEACVKYLEEQQLIERPLKGRPDIFKPTLLGMKYGEYTKYERRHFVRNSIIIPILVSTLTTILIHGLSLLSQLILSLVLQSNLVH